MKKKVRHFCYHFINFSIRFYEYIKITLVLDIVYVMNCVHVDARKRKQLSNKAFVVQDLGQDCLDEHIVKTPG